ncbi:MAG: VWA domain-containing protein [Gammaproteobacteria bacterium]|nr:VWA domain-containing protein [Gammaproteobacteria bacterium]MBQ0840741.1 VWA domain-containing protein [Gammaproteobacteria bacterium]
MKRARRPAIEISISFLDVISCGFGAIVLLLLIAKTVEFTAPEESQSTLQNQGVTTLQEQLFSLRGETQQIKQVLTSKREQLSELEKNIAKLRQQLASVNRQLQASAQADTTERDELILAQQILSEEMQRLQQRGSPNANQLIGGIPVDSEYLVFIIDTSGSMVDFAWPKVREELINILDIYPTVKGIQVMNDMGDYMFESYRGKWLPDTPGRRRAIIKQMTHWRPFSNSSPVEGIQRAIRAFYASDKKISLYVFGDDFTGGSIHKVLNAVAQSNRQRGRKKQRVRIHTIGFPVHFLAPGGRMESASRFATLMRELSYRNGGTFVGLNSLSETR